MNNNNPYEILLVSQSVLIDALHVAYPININEPYRSRIKYILQDETPKYGDKVTVKSIINRYIVIIKNIREILACYVWNWTDDGDPDEGFLNELCTIIHPIKQYKERIDEELGL